MTTIPTRAKRTWIWATAGAVVLLGALGIAYAVYHAKSPGTRKVHGGGEGASSGPRQASNRQVEALGLAYPASKGTLPASITISYNAHKDRTKMTLELRKVPTDPGSAAGVSDVIIKLMSEYDGRTRPADRGESSVDGVVIVKCKAPGPLVVSGAPGAFEADGQSVHLHPPAKDKPAYSSETQPDHVKETLAFRVRTAGLLKVAQAKSVTASFGSVRVHLTEEQLGDLREYAARMNPKP